ncbi:amidohydrolase family protein [Cupriavidus sp. AcVe19-6a]|uniref:amidohydrolase family protein n=1 Tax=Cupriavidus sp. AcVe19-6a TaxID=2821358 RepID=UPI001AE4528E|nr:amidohydrolase family protein [Cupriavidus sp. AcVe19-6a]MBP0638819.1 amidohydrolase family protein [Cupriavidus sp. AcVe19-6a]
MKTRFLFTAVLVAAGVGLAAACNGGDDTTPVTSGTVIDHVAIVNTRDGSTSSDMAVLVDGGVIRSIARGGSFRVEGAATRVDGTGQYLVPGYNDMHTHVLDQADLPPTHFLQMIANGITGFREMAGSAALIARAKTLNADSAAGKVLAPELLAMPSTLITVPQADAAVQLVQQARADGADFVKVVNATPASFPAIMAEAGRQRLPVVGHLSPTVSPAAASAAGMRGIEHLGPALGVLLGCSTDEDAIRADILKAPPIVPNVTSPFLPRTPEAPWFQRAMDTFSEEKCRALARTFVANGTWQTPTLYRIRTMQFSTDAVFRNDANLKYIEPGRRANWQALADQYAATMSPGNDAIFRSFYDFEVRALQIFRAEGVRMLAGSDAGGIWCIPGFSLQAEFRQLAQAGFTPLEILRMTTLDAADFLGRTSSMGTVEQGKNADLVLLEADPLADAANLGRIAGVFLKGRYQSKAVLQAMLADVENAYMKQPASAYREDPNHKH